MVISNQKSKKEYYLNAIFLNLKNNYSKIDVLEKTCKNNPKAHKIGLRAKFLSVGEAGVRAGLEYKFLRTSLTPLTLRIT
ncbi:hypothetical protein BpHYR1_048696 [Brachionus plicatilis]|uniref:Uncharacterized protein n=1 Tax=Brachionus plicatilis TaxID=10195 RepID=A0A3M7S570_BRAPC|nr:hypothetical protein BpHYR1_048696 [Brachionus plicatilis]